MKKLKQLAYKEEDHRLTISRCNSEFSLSDSIPQDVLMDIISRLPAKSIANCRRVSKSWASILRRHEFDELFLTKSPNQPRILFAFIIDGGLPFFTSRQGHENSSTRARVMMSPISQATHHHTYLPIDRFSQISSHVRGLVCLEDKRRMLVVCNPITCETLTLPKLKSEMLWSRSVFGYDPIDKKFKVFRTTWSPHHPLNTPAEHYVLTLGNGNMNWRMIECCKPIRPVFDGGICINGVLYYIAKLNCYPEDLVIVCFDVRFEKLSLIYKPKDMRQIVYESRLINHKGRLGLFQCSDCRIITRDTTSFDLWILEDAEKHEWTKRIYVLPSLWKSFVANTKLRIVGMTGTCEIVLSPYYLSDRYYYIFYYNLEMNTVRRVLIQGFEAFQKNAIAHLFLDYVEDVKFV